MTNKVFDLTDEEIRIASNLYNIRITDKLDHDQRLTLDEFKRIYTTLLDSLIFMESLARSDVYQFDEIFEDCAHTVNHMKEALNWIDEYISSCQERTGHTSGSDEVLRSDLSQSVI